MRCLINFLLNHFEFIKEIFIGFSNTCSTIVC